jgi:hypothetical protein
MYSGTSSSWERQDHVRRQSSNTAIAASLAQLSRELGANPKTAAKWRRRAAVDDKKTRSKGPPSIVLCKEEEAGFVSFPKDTLLPFDDCPNAVTSSIPNLTQSSLHRCLRRLAIVAPPVRARWQMHLAYSGRRGCSSLSRGERHIWGGKAGTCRALYLAAFIAFRYDPTFKAFRKRLQDIEKPTKVAITACARKIHP